MREGKLNNLQNYRRRIYKWALDIILVVLGIGIGFYTRFEGTWHYYFKPSYIVVYLFLFLLVYTIRKCGLKSWSYTNSLDVLNLGITHIIAVLLTYSYFAITHSNFSRGIVILGGTFALFLQLSLRFLVRLRRSYKIILGKKATRKKTLIYGAGETGVALVRESFSNQEYPYFISGFIDDNRKKRGDYISGIKVYGDFLDIDKIIKKLDIEMVIIALPRLGKEKTKKIIDKFNSYDNIAVKLLPAGDDILQELDVIKQIRDVSIEDLLGREEISVNSEKIEEKLHGKTILVTGGAGSIGSELVRQVAKYHPKKIITLDLNENALYFLELELKRNNKDLDIQSEICNIREIEKLDYLFDKYKPNIVFHAAAHKHVPLMEHNPEEAVKNNIFGTKNVIDIADKYKVERFILVSTDKAVNPTNIMGATKRAAELLIEEKNKVSETKYMATRFGNVLGSNGSVIPLFKTLIEEGRNITITHPEITRYFMTIPEAASLVIEAGCMSKGGEVFVLDMGEPVKIMDLAKNLIKLSGLRLGEDIEIEVTGLRPGEKLYEELLYDVKNAKKTENNKIFIVDLGDHCDEAKPEILEQLKEKIENREYKEIKGLVKELVKTYKDPEEVNNKKK